MTIIAILKRFML